MKKFLEKHKGTLIITALVLLAVLIFLIVLSASTTNRVKSGKYFPDIQVMDEQSGEPTVISKLKYTNVLTFWNVPYTALIPSNIAMETGNLIAAKDGTVIAAVTEVTKDADLETCAVNVIGTVMGDVKGKASFYKKASGYLNNRQTSVAGVYAKTKNGKVYGEIYLVTLEEEAYNIVFFAMSDSPFDSFADVTDSIFYSLHKKGTSYFETGNDDAGSSTTGEGYVEIVNPDDATDFGMEEEGDWDPSTIGQSGMVVDDNYSYDEVVTKELEVKLDDKYINGSQHIIIVFRHSTLMYEELPFLELKDPNGTVHKRDRWITYLDGTVGLAYVWEIDFPVEGTWTLSYISGEWLGSTSFFSQDRDTYYDIYTVQDYDGAAAKAAYEANAAKEEANYATGVCTIETSEQGVFLFINGSEKEFWALDLYGAGVTEIDGRNGMKPAYAFTSDQFDGVGYVFFSKVTESDMFKDWCMTGYSNEDIKYADEKKMKFIYIASYDEFISTYNPTIID